jgi:hypothetical protein
MFESKIVQAGRVDAAADRASAEDGLRALAWGELSARLGAARDFRRLMAGGPGAGAASFDPSCAHHLAALGDGKPGINPIDLSDGRMTNSMDLATCDAMSGNRGRA